MKKLGIFLIVLGLIGVCFFAIRNNNQTNGVTVPIKQQTQVSANVAAVSVVNNKGNNVMNVSDVNSSMIKHGDVTVVGYIKIQRYTTNNHLKAVLKDLYNDSHLDVILFSKTMRKFPEFENIIKNCNDTNTPIFVYGPITRYKGNLEIKAFKVYTK